MATSVYFNNYASSQEQLLIENLVIESIKIYGHDVWYMPRTLVNKDVLYGESSIQEFNSAYMVEMYVKNVEGFQGQGDFLSKFNLEIRDEMTLTIARRIFEQEVGALETLTRPREGDLIYFPLNRKTFQIKFVEHEPVFYQMGALQMYDLKCELFEYSDEIFNTGIKEIDAVYASYSTSFDVAGIILNESVVSDQTYLTDEDGFLIIQEFYNLSDQDINAENDYIQTQSDLILDFSEQDPFSENGTF